jgi:hypothetical protein
MHIYALSLNFYLLSFHNLLRTSLCYIYVSCCLSVSRSLLKSLLVSLRNHHHLHLIRTSQQDEQISIAPQHITSVTKHNPHPSTTPTPPTETSPQPPLKHVLPHPRPQARARPYLRTHASTRHPRALHQVYVHQIPRTPTRPDRPLRHAKLPQHRYRHTVRISPGVDACQSQLHGVLRAGCNVGVGEEE